MNIPKQQLSLLLSITALLLSSTIVCGASISSVSDGAWNAVTTWSTQTIPSPLDDVTVIDGHTVTLEGSCTARTLSVNGTLTSSSTGAEHSLFLRSEWILVSGAQARLSIGTEQSPYLGSCHIELIGINDGDMMGDMGDKFIGTMNGGVTSLHGTPYDSWSRLSAMAVAGQTSITLENTVNWKPGQQIILL